MLPELMIDLAIQHGYWGAVPFTQCSPAHPIWRENPEWLLKANKRFLCE